MHLKKKELKSPALQKLIVDYCSIKEIEAARDLLHENFPIDYRPSALRKKRRQGDSKADNVVTHIYEVFQFMSVIVLVT